MTSNVTLSRKDKVHVLGGCGGDLGSGWVTLLCTLPCFVPSCAPWALAPLVRRAKMTPENRGVNALWKVGRGVLMKEL